MSKVLKIENGGYTIKVQSGQSIVLDTARGNADGNNRPNGNVIVRGNLEVEGSTITVESVNTTLNDNILTLNKFTATETQTNGIPATKNSVGGIEIDRGNYANAKFLFDENISWTHGGTTTQGTFKITTEEGSETLLPLYTSGIKSPSTLYVLPGSGVITVSGSADYEEGIFTYSGNSINDGGSGVVIDDDHIPNTKAVVDYVSWFVTNSGNIAGVTNFDTKITVSDFQSNSTASKATVAIDNVDKTVFYSDRVELYGTIKASNTGLTSITTNGDLQLSANGTGEVFVNDILRITESTDPTTPTASVKLYAKTPAGGKTGIFFKNKNGTTDELISRKRAILYSLMF